MSSDIDSNYDVAIIGGGHNGLVSACYLAQAGLSVAVLERNAEFGGATRSAHAFNGHDARLSIYSYLISLFPEKIVADLGLNLKLRSRKTSSWTPGRDSGGNRRELLIRNNGGEANRDAFRALTGSDRDYGGYLQLQQMQESLANVIWPTLTSPLVTRDEMRERLAPEDLPAWQALIEEPIGIAIERLIEDDLIRGLVFTDGKIGVSTFPHDPALLQNRSFLYHVIGRGTGEWRVPVGGMGALVDELLRVARSTGRVRFLNRAHVCGIDPGERRSAIAFELDGEPRGLDARFVLCNASAQVLGELVGTPAADADPSCEGAGFKVNMLLEKLPPLRSGQTAPSDAFAGTLHVNEGYQQMLASYRESVAGEVPAVPPGEIYCHTLTDHSILSDDLNRRGFQTLTLFGLDMPYRLFEGDNEAVRSAVLEKYLAGINEFLAEPIEGYLAKDADGKPCIEAMSAVDLEHHLRLPKGNIFHGDLTWPFVETEDERGLWGVETAHPSILLCGSAAKRGGAVSGIPGHNAAMKVLELAGRSTSV